jgi:DNA-binding NarL/FixJ family response regulator
VSISRIRVFLVDDHVIWRGGVKSMLEDTEFEVAGEASSGKEAVETIRFLNSTHSLPQLVA